MKPQKPKSIFVAMSNKRRHGHTNNEPVTCSINYTYVQALHQIGAYQVLILPPSRGVADELATATTLTRLDSLSPAAINFVMNFQATLNRVDGILLRGGQDISPDLYGQTRGPKTGEPDFSTDVLERLMVLFGIENNIPILGICRGMQMINISLGGQLVQDIPTDISTLIEHKSASGERSKLVHPVNLAHGKLASILGQTQIWVNSFHHQAANSKHLGRDILITGLAPDGVVEAIEYHPHHRTLREKVGLDDEHFCIGVQWHPEEIYESMNSLWNAFKEACLSRKKTWYRRLFENWLKRLTS